MTTTVTAATTTPTTTATTTVTTTTTTTTATTTTTTSGHIENIVDGRGRYKFNTTKQKINSEFDETKVTLPIYRVIGPNWAKVKINNS